MARVIAMIQARTGSKRFPRKVLAKIENKPMMWHVINRIKQVKGIQQIILITTEKKEDRILLRLARESGILGFAGDVNNVLKRYFRCAVLYHADAIIRITGDCPLIDPNVVEKMLTFYKKHDYDYVSNTFPPTFPDGLDTEIFSFKTLQRIAHDAKLKSDREHVTPYIRKNVRKFKIFNYENELDLSQFRWTVDEKNDLKFVRKIYHRMRPENIFSMKDILGIISKNPKILEINKGIRRNESYSRSLKKDRD